MDKFILLFLVFFPIIVGLINYFIGKKFNKVREIIAIITSIIEFALTLVVVFINPISNEFANLCFKADGFRSIYALIASFMWMCTLVFSHQYMAHYNNKDRYYLFYLLTLGATIGVLYSTNLWTTFMFFEMMSLTSFVLVIHDEKKETISAAITYLVIAIISGMILLMGMFMIQSELHTTDFEQLSILCSNGISSKVYIGGVLLLFGFGAKAGMFPLHIWLPKAHPVAPAPASALLSGILTKTGVFGIIICVTCIFQSVKSFAILLLILAVITMFLGAVLAVFSINLKRTLACSSMSQIGFILTGLSMMIFLSHENSLAFEGSFLHMVNHSLIKLSLFMLAGVIFMNIHKLNLNEIRGYGKRKYMLMACFIIGALSIMGIPMFCGYVSKTLIHEAIVEYASSLSGISLFLIKSVEYIFLFSGGLTIAYMIKLFVCIFIEKNNNENVQQEFNKKDRYMNLASTIVILLSTIVLPFIGLLPNICANGLVKFAYSFFNVNKDELEFIKYFSFENLKGALISLAIGLIVYFGIIRVFLMRKNENGQKEYVDIWPSWLDMQELIYKPIIFGYRKKTSDDDIALSKLSIVCIMLFRALSQSMDAIIYVFKRYILRQYKYQFTASPLSYRLGAIIDKYKKNKLPYFSYRIQEEFAIIKNVKDTLNATFAFDFLMACIGVVVVLILMLI